MNGVKTNDRVYNYQELPATAAGSAHNCMLPLLGEAFLSCPEQADSMMTRQIYARQGALN
ncbi:hypothetical protein N7486_007466 [Penicillium sp. IBT 16267x]|nr:hypothetical protein N7486_007466 [Penicillium sp. IBT 16267x]